MVPNSRTRSSSIKSTHSVQSITEISPQRTRELKMDYLSLRKEVSSILVSSDFNRTPQTQTPRRQENNRSPLPSARGSSNPQSATVTPRTGKYLPKTILPSPVLPSTTTTTDPDAAVNINIDSDNHEDVPVKSSLESIWDSFINVAITTPMALSSSITTASMDLSSLSLWGAKETATATAPATVTDRNSQNNLVQHANVLDDDADVNVDNRDGDGNKISQGYLERFRDDERAEGGEGDSDTERQMGFEFDENDMFTIASTSDLSYSEQMSRDSTIDRYINRNDGVNKHYKKKNNTRSYLKSVNSSISTNFSNASFEEEKNENLISFNAKNAAEYLKFKSNTRNPISEENRNRDLNSNGGLIPRLNLSQMNKECSPDFKNYNDENQNQKEKENRTGEKKGDYLRNIENGNIENLDDDDFNEMNMKFNISPIVLSEVSSMGASLLASLDANGSDYFHRIEIQHSEVDSRNYINSMRHNNRFENNFNNRFENNFRGNKFENKLENKFDNIFDSKYDIRFHFDDHSGNGRGPPIHQSASSSSSSYLSSESQSKQDTERESDCEKVRNSMPNGFNEEFNGNDNERKTEIGIEIEDENLKSDDNSEYEELKLWRTLDLEADASFAEGLLQTKNNLKMELESIASSVK